MKNMVGMERNMYYSEIVQTDLEWKKYDQTYLIEFLTLDDGIPFESFVHTTITESSVEFSIICYSCGSVAYNQVIRFLSMDILLLTPHGSIIMVDLLGRDSSLNYSIELMELLHKENMGKVTVREVNSQFENSRKLKIVTFELKNKEGAISILAHLNVDNFGKFRAVKMKSENIIIEEYKAEHDFHKGVDD